MKQSLAILVVIAVVAALSSAALYTPTKDAFLRYDGSAGTPWVDPAYYGQGIYTYGGQGYGRVGKAYNQERFVIDFDRAAILAQVSTELGHTATAADFTSGGVTVTLYLTACPSSLGAWTPAPYYPGFITSTSAWTSEGRASWSYADGTDGNNPIDLPNTTPWNGTVAGVQGLNQSSLGQVPRGDAIPGTTGSVRDCPWYVDLAYNSGQPVWWTATDVYTPFVLSGAEAAGYLFNPLNAYIAMCEANNANSSIPAIGNNGLVYSKETANKGPLLNVVVPEPMTLSLLAAGALALIRRRK